MSNILIDETSLRILTRNILIAHGAEASEADIMAGALVWCDCMGRLNHGVWRLPIHTKRLSLGLIHSPCHPRVVQAAPAVEILDGNQGFGYVVGHLAMKRAIELARQSGVGIVGVNNSNFFGTGAYFIQLAAEANMIGIAMSNSVPHVAPFGGVKAVFGTNPFAFGAPRRNGRSILVDLSTASSAGSTVMKLLEQNAELPGPIGIDKQGAPTRDPGQVAALLPFGGVKGYALGLMVEIFCGVLTGAGIADGVKSTHTNFQEPCNNGHLFLALDIAKCMRLEVYYERLETLTDLLMASSAPGEKATVRLPGEERWLARDRSFQEGIRLDEKTARSLKELAEKAGLPCPLP